MPVTPQLPRAPVTQILEIWGAGLGGARCPPRRRGAIIRVTLGALWLMPQLEEKRFSPSNFGPGVGWLELWEKGFGHITLVLVGGMTLAWGEGGLCHITWAWCGMPRAGGKEV